MNKPLHIRQGMTPIGHYTVLAKRKSGQRRMEVGCAHTPHAGHQLLISSRFLPECRLTKCSFLGYTRGGCPHECCDYEEPADDEHRLQREHVPWARCAHLPAEGLPCARYGRRWRRARRSEGAQILEIRRMYAASTLRHARGSLSKGSWARDK